MKDNYSTCLNAILEYEGGWSDHPKDPGGATMMGITLNTYRRYKPGATKAQLKNITRKEVEAIYREGYWDKVRGDDLPLGIDLTAFDPAVNSGPSRGAKWLQKALGVTADGIVGTNTVAAAKTDPNPIKVIQKAHAYRLGWLRGLSTFTTFGRGWTNRVVSNEAKAVAMASNSVLRLELESTKAEEKAKLQGTVATTSGGATSVGSTYSLFELGTYSQEIITLTIVAGIFVVVMLSKYKISKSRAKAYAREAAMKEMI